MTSSLYGHKAAYVVTHVSRPELRPGGDSWSSSRRTSPHPGVEKHTGKTKSRKSSFPWSLKKSDSECSLIAHKHGWKPVILSGPVLASFCVISLLLIAIVEVLAQHSQRTGGLFLSPDADNLSPLVTFSYLFLPTIVAVIYSLFWSWVDLDAKRIQPWYELSRPEGADADDSILLSYPYDFVGSVPLTAFRKRHWPVFFSGTTMVIIFWLLTPLQSSIMGTGSVIVSRDVEFSGTTGFIPLAQHALELDQSILNEGYAITWLEQPYPPFTTKEYTLLPFDLPADASRSPSANWTGTTTKYWTSLDCWPAAIERELPESKRTFNFDDGRGCNASGIAAYGQFNGKSPYKMMYLGHQTSAFVDYALAGPTCPNADHEFLAIWSHHNATLLENRPNDIRLEAVFCETSYHQQKVRATVSSDGMVPFDDTIVPLEPAETFTGTDFNITALEHLIGAGITPIEIAIQREYPFSRLLEQYPQAVDLGMTWPMSPMVGFALGSREITSLEEFNDQSMLGDAFNATHKLMFSLALRKVFLKTTDDATAPGSLEFSMHGIVVSRLWSAVVEGLLGLVSLFTFALWWFSSKAPSNLTGDPSSLRSLIDMCSNSASFLDALSGKGCLSEEELATAFPRYRFQLACGCQSRSGRMMIQVTRSDGRDHEAAALEEFGTGKHDLLAARGHYSPVKPWALRRSFGASTILIMMGVVALLAWLKFEEHRQSGLTPPTGSFEVQQLIFSFLPTAFATAFEPLWVLVNRLLCIVQPFQDLWSGQKVAKGSINARYTSVPPQLVFWRAFGARHFLLSAVCAVAVLSNLLAVGLGGLFNHLPAKATYEQEFQQTLLPMLVNETIYDNDFLPQNNAAFYYDEPFFVAMSNVSRGTTLPPWITEDFYMQPFTLPNDRQSRADSYTANTMGFGVTPHCSPAGVFKSKTEGPILNHTMGRLTPGVECPTQFQPEIPLNTTMYDLPAGKSSAEVVFTLVPYMYLDVCGTVLFLGWSRAPEASDPDGEMETSFVACEPVFSTAMFRTTVNTDGHVLEAVNFTEPKTTLDYAESTNHTDSMIVLMNHLFRRPTLPWHNDTLSRDWMNYLLKIRPGNSDILDPEIGVPDPASLVPSIEAVYRQVFALLLGLNDEVFARSTEPSVIYGTQEVAEVRIFMPMSAFVISVAVLGLNIFTALILYTIGVKHFLPRMPTTIGSILAYVAPSRAVREISDDSGPGSPARTFSFGRYVGDDGRAHVGIELDPYVVPVKLSSLKKGNTKPKSRLRRAFTRETSSTGNQAWL
ncbi:hypothetical protein B0T11DRAFT_351863 [Plectosphaerella cucumerina]|uniref:Uncharacterized protein n=1 Tax=Plectosphaerella cucumerina TaxID=40658 RepID=A0A8K0X2S8_9PEZI|nr:hypothetical protein B0T11DRAFT_351863 [Plectosphaerella cucumerina]